MARFMMRYRTYNFTKKNPVIDKVRTILQDEGMYAKNKRYMLHQLTGVSVSTYDNWFEGDTKNPNHAGIAATLTALGYEERFVRTKKLDLEEELVAAKAWLKKQKAAKAAFNATQPQKKKKAVKAINAKKAKVAEYA